MPDRVALFVPLPRAITAAVRPRRTPERFAAYDTMPIEVESLSHAEAPLVMRRKNLNHWEEAQDVRLHEGRFYMPLDLQKHVHGCTPEELPEVLDLTIRLGLSDSHYGNHRHLWDWPRLLRDTEKSRVIVDAETLNLGRVDDDGRAAQADLARYLSQELMLVGGRVYHRTLTPRYETHEDNSYYRVSNPVPYPTPWMSGPDIFTATQFRPDRIEEAQAFSDALYLRSGKEPAEMAENRHAHFEILEPELLTAALPEDDLPAATTQALTYFTMVARDAMGHLKDESVGTFLDLRALARAGVPDDESALAAIDRVRELLPEIRAAARPGDRDFSKETRTSINRAIRATRNVILRHDVIDRPRKLSLPPDLLGLAP